MRLLGVVGAAVMAVACGGSSSSQPGPKASGPAPTCAVLADHVAKLVRKRDESVDRLREVFAERCERDGWSDEFRTCVVGTESLAKPKRCKDLLSGLQREALDRGIRDAELGTENSACHEYVRMVKKLRNCKNYTKDMVEQSIQTAGYYLEEYERAETRETQQFALQSCEDMMRNTEYTLASCNNP